MKEQILACLSPDFPWADRFEFFNTIDSTNSHLKELAKEGAPHGTILAADHQSGGRGRLGRSFLSPAGVGMYMSILLRPECRPGELLHLTCAAAVAMCDAVEKAAGIRPGIKWTNDLVYKQRKLAGILTEMGLRSDGLADYAIIGIGVNCCQKIFDFPPELQATAGSLEMVSGKPVNRAKLAANMMEALKKMDQGLIENKSAMLEQYRKDCITLGKEVSLVRGEEIRHGRAMDIDEEGALVVVFADGHKEAIGSGEVSVRGMYGYV